ncbi:TraR/DksA family transcriptional regulator [Streptomyces natalensis]|uniref:DNA-binding protein n=1 Tax=Streptomyces natalensis ATCC 27448 TaxID=1240678 RepID=A0A0D7CS83_9ACTN|nr:TraR/DksA C4-type zinc finger protein [Streptomyces natalensis]KIZ18252.1 DNA-binding protein [Streptomyces natalensis ATCC 27448]
MVAKKTAAQTSSTPADEADEAVAKRPASTKTVPRTAKKAKPAAEDAGGAKDATPRKPVAKKTVAKKAAEKKTVAKKAAAKKPAAAPAKKTGAQTVEAKKTAAPAAHAMDGAVPPARAAATPGELAVRPGEDPWTPAEVAEARTVLREEVGRLNGEITASEDAIAGLMRDSGDGAGDDEADTGSKNITREHELALASNAREMLHQTERALGRLDAGTYGLCENCGRPIGKARMQAFPRATLCVECKQKQERRA